MTSLLQPCDGVKEERERPDGRTWSAFEVASELGIGRRMGEEIKEGRRFLLLEGGV